MSVSYKIQKNKNVYGALENVSIWVDTAFLIVEALYIAYNILKQSTIPLFCPDNIENILLSVISTAAGIRLIFWLLASNGDKNDAVSSEAGKSRRKHIIDAVLFLLLLGYTIVLYLLLYNKNDSLELLIYLILTVGNIGISYKNVLKAYTISSFVTLSVAILYGMARVTVDYVRFEDGNIRGSMGICYPTDYASFILFAVIIGAAAFEKLSIWIVAVGALLSFLNAHFIADSNNGSICSILFLVLTFFMLLDKYLLKKKKSLEWISRIFRGVTTFSFAICAFVMLMMTTLYGNDIGLLNRINSLLNGRLYLANQALNEHGVSFLGNIFNQEGAGFSFFANENYNFIDSSYPYILIRYGVIYLIFCALVSSVLIYRAWKNENRRMVTALTIISLHSVIEHHYIECLFNVFILMLFAIPDNPKTEAAGASYKTEDGSEDIKIELGISIKEIVMVVLVFGFVIFLPKLLNGIKTIVISKGYFTGDTLKWKYVFGVGIGFLFLYAGIYGISGLVENAIKRSKRRNAVYAIASAGGILVLIGYGFIYSISLKAAGEVYKAEVNEDIGIVAHTVDIARGRVYEDTMPVLYKKMGAKIAEGYWRGEELGRLKNVSVFMDRDYDSKIFWVKGFKACEVSGLHVLYTNDDSVIDGLSEEGYEFFDRYPVEKNVDIYSEAVMNSLAYDEDGCMLLDGLDHSLIFGPYVGLFSDNYRITYDLVIDKSQIPDDRYICTLSVRSLYGKNILGEKAVYASDFDEDGLLRTSVDCYIDEARGCEFLCFADYGVELGIRQITYMHMK